MKKDNVRKIKQLQQEDGAALIWVMILFMVVFFTGTTVALIQNADVKEVSSVENRLTSYYAAIGGTELGLGFLYTDVGSTKVIDEYIKYLKGETTSINFTQTVTAPSVSGTGSSDRSLTYTYSYPAGAVVPEATVVVKIYQRDPNDKYVVVQSIGEYIDSGVKTFDYTRIRKDNIKTIHRDGKTLLDE